MKNWWASLFVVAFVGSGIADTIEPSRWAGPPGTGPGSYEEWIALHPIDTGDRYVRLDTAVANGLAEAEWVAIYTDSVIDTLIKVELQQLTANLLGDGYSVVRYSVSPFVDPAVLRDRMRAQRDSFPFEGALFIGNIPVAWYMRAQFDTLNEVWWPEYWPMDLFYMDLDGIWLDTLRGDTTGTDSMYDTHIGTGAPEIYVGRILPTGMGDSVQIIKDYLRKDNAYRHDSLRLPPTALCFMDDDWHNDTVKVAYLRQAYPATQACLDPESTTAATYSSMLRDPRAWVHVTAHGYPGGHKFYSDSGHVANYYYASQYASEDPPANFYNHHTCSFGRYTDTGCGAGVSVLRTSCGMVAVATTKEGSMTNDTMFYDPLSGGASIGQSFLDWFKFVVPDSFNIWNMRWYYGMVLLGDPFLKPVLQRDVTVEAVVSPVGQSGDADTVIPSARLSNIGRQQESFLAVLTIEADGQEFYADTLLVESLDAWAPETVQFRPVFLDSGLYRVKARTLLDGDENALNDTAVGVAVVAAAQGWAALAEMPPSTSGRYAKDGAWLAYDASDCNVYAAKGNKTDDVYSYCPLNDVWARLASWPTGIEGKAPWNGSSGCAGGDGVLYATKGNNTLGFWKYDVASNVWSQKADVPLGIYGKKVKGGTGLVSVGNTIYMLKGYKNEFWKYLPACDTWIALPSAPEGVNPKWDKGSWLVYDGDNTIYAHKAKYHELHRFDVASGQWDTAAHLAAMPLIGESGKSKKSKDGGCGAFMDGFIYALKGGNTQEFWRYDTAPNSWAEMETIPSIGSTGRKKKVKGGGGIASDGVLLYALKGNKTLEFWRYAPSESIGTVASVRRASGGGGLDEGETPMLEGMEAYTPRWRSNGTAIVVTSEDTLGWLQVWKIAYSGGIGSITQLTDVEMDCEQPVFNPAGTLVAFTLDDDSTGFYQIAVVSAGTGGGGGGGTDGAEGGTFAAVADAQVSAIAVPGSASPTGSGAAGTADDVRTVQVGMVSAMPGSGATPASYSITVLTSDEYDHYDPAWSLDSNYIVYTKDGDDGRSHIWRIPATGGQEEQLTFGSTCEEVEPSYINADEVVFTSIPDGDDYDQIGKVNVSTHDVTALTSSETDHEAADPAANGSAVAFQALDEAGNFQIAKVSSSGGSETFLTESDQDMEEPDWSPDNQSVFCVRWTGITSAICRVDAQSGGYVAVTDSSAIRDNPDVWYNPTGNTSYIVYEREAWDEGSLLGFGRGRKRGTGVFLSKHRKPMDGPMGGSLYTFALDGARPNPAADRVTIRWSLPNEADVSLKVYSTAGRLVRTLAEGKTRPGTYTTVWDGTDAQGRELASGIYFYRLDAGDRRTSRKVVLQH